METIRPSRTDAQVKIDFRRSQQTHGGTVESRRRAVKRHALHAMRITYCVHLFFKTFSSRLFRYLFAEMVPRSFLQDMNNIIKRELKRPRPD